MPEHRERGPPRRTTFAAACPSRRPVPTGPEMHCSNCVRAGGDARYRRPRRHRAPPTAGSKVPPRAVVADHSDPGIAYPLPIVAGKVPGLVPVATGAFTVILDGTPTDKRNGATRGRHTSARSRTVADFGKSQAFAVAVCGLSYASSDTSRNYPASSQHRQSAHRRRRRRLWRTQ